MAKKAVATFKKGDGPQRTPPVITSTISKT